MFFPLFLSLFCVKIFIPVFFLLTMELTVLQSILLGVIQGIAEWLPVSSSGIIALVMSNFLDAGSLEPIISKALWLHLGTFLAALIYFWKDVYKIFKAPFKPKGTYEGEKKMFSFFLVVTIITGIIGFAFFEFLTSYEDSLNITGKTITALVGALLLVTGLLQISVKKKGLRGQKDINHKDSVILGISQGFASLPGVSRSGITIASLLLRRFNDTSALKLSFIMGLPVVLVGNLLLNMENFALGGTAIYGLLVSFIVGIAAIHGLMKLSRKINFGWFVLVFAILMVLSIFI